MKKGKEQRQHQSWFWSLFSEGSGTTGSDTTVSLGPHSVSYTASSHHGFDWVCGHLCFLSGLFCCSVSKGGSSGNCSLPLRHFSLGKVFEQPSSLGRWGNLYSTCVVTRKPEDNSHLTSGIFPDSVLCISQADFNLSSLPVINGK